MFAILLWEKIRREGYHILLFLLLAITIASMLHFYIVTYKAGIPQSGTSTLAIRLIKLSPFRVICKDLFQQILPDAILCNHYVLDVRLLFNRFRLVSTFGKDHEGVVAHCASSNVLRAIQLISRASSNHKLIFVGPLMKRGPPCLY